MADTDNNEYNRPAQGSTDWHIPLNENFTQLDTDVEIRDTDSNRSNYTPKDKAKFVATDTHEVYLGDGNNWNKIGRILPDSEVAKVLSNGEVELAADGDGSGNDVLTFRIHAPNGAELVAAGLTNASGSTISGVNVNCELSTTGASATTVTSKHSTLSDSTTSATDVVMEVDNTNASSTTVIPFLEYRTN